MIYLQMHCKEVLITELCNIERAEAGKIYKAGTCYIKLSAVDEFVGQIKEAGVIDNRYALELGVIDEIAGRTSIAVDEAMQSTKKINEMKDKIKQSNFADQLKEFEELVKPEEQEDDVSMETFFNMFSL